MVYNYLPTNIGGTNFPSFYNNKIITMSNIKEQIKATFAKFGIDPAAHGIKFEEEAAAPAAETKVEFAVEGTLNDGTKIYSTANEWVVGVDIYTQDAEGNPVPVPAGEYILEDGVTKVVVGEDGLVAEIEKEEQSTEMSSEDLVAVIGSLSERISALEAEKTELSAALVASQDEIKSVKAELSSVKKAPAVASVKSQEFKKNAAPVVASNGNSFSDFMESIRSKQSN
jgi:hypothetical protein